MIKLDKINKYYNKNKLNEIHVINDTTLEFPETGLVALTGPSGCGKTTILNVIGGLDSFESGILTVIGEEIKSYDPVRWDIIRNKYIGYIFQNYNLVIDKTVYENVEIALNMAGLYDKKMVEERVHYVLKSVGMYNYRKRSVLALSGGQQQRVAIARALAKNPRVILADEPTGNLDANNTFEVMSLIKKISKTCLVILVSHERELVDFYADRVVELMDGKIINDYQNEGNRTLERIDDRNIYLRDLNLQTVQGVADVDFYFDEELGKTPKITLVKTSKTLFVKVDSPLRVKYLSSDAEIRLIDDHYRKPETDDAAKHLFDLAQFPAIAETNKRRSFIRFRDTLKAGLNKVINGRKVFSKLFLIVYFVISALVVFNLATLGNLTRTEPSEFITRPQNMVGVNLGADDTEAKVNQILAADGILRWSPYADLVYANFRFEDLYQGSGYKAATSWQPVYPIRVSDLRDATVVAGRLPENKDEIALDQWIADKILEQKSILDLGISTYADLIGGQAYADGRETTLEIVGVVFSQAPVVVLSDANIHYFAALQSGGMSLGTALGTFTLGTGSQLLQDGEAMLPSYSSLSLGSPFAVGGINFTVVGFYTDSTANFIVNEHDFARLLQKEALATNEAKTLYFFAEDADSAVSTLGALDISATATATSALQAFREQQLQEVGGRLQTIVISLLGAVVFIFFSMRSSMLGRIKEIGVYRSIGATKADIYKIFVSEILVFTTIGSLSGYLFMTYIVSQVESMFQGVISVFYFPLWIALSGIVVIYLVNLLFGMIPIFGLLRKTPSEINAKYDI
jgi:ABC-type lipoprotein export system ATPase subunit